MSETIDGYMRVTEILSPHSGLHKVKPDILRKAADRGEKVHQICDGIVQGMPPLRMDIELTPYVEAFEKWLPDQKVVETEKRLFCKRLMITGKFDLIVESEDGLYLYDIKTPVKKSKSWPVQLAAYQYLAKENNYDIKGFKVLKLSKEATFEVISYDQDVDYFSMFMKCYDAFRYFNEKKGAFHHQEYDEFSEYI